MNIIHGITVCILNRPFISNLKKIFYVIPIFFFMWDRWGGAPVPSIHKPSLLKTFFQNFCGPSLCYSANSCSAVRTLLLIRSSRLVVWHLYFCSWCLVQMLDCDASTVGLVGDVTVVLGFFITALTIFLSSAVDYFPSFHGIRMACFSAFDSSLGQFSCYFMFF